MWCRRSTKFLRPPKRTLDAAISAITVTDERKLLVDFTPPYFESGKAPVSFYNPGQGIAIRTDNTTITGVESLTEGVRLGVKTGTTGATFAAENTTAELVDLLRRQPSKRWRPAIWDVVIVDIPVIVGYIKSNPAAGIRIMGEPVTEEVYAIAVGKEKPAALALLDAALVEVQDSGAYDQIITTVFGRRKHRTVAFVLFSRPVTKRDSCGRVA